jgi:hypothetical protein
LDILREAARAMMEAPPERRTIKVRPDAVIEAGQLEIEVFIAAASSPLGNCRLLFVVGLNGEPAEVDWDALMSMTDVVDASLITTPEPRSHPRIFGRPPGQTAASATAAWAGSLVLTTRPVPISKPARVVRRGVILRYQRSAGET